MDSEKRKKRRIKRAMSEMDIPTRQILLMRHYYDFSFAEIASVICLPVSTIRALHRAARRRIARAAR